DPPAPAGGVPNLLGNGRSREAVGDYEEAATAYEAFVHREPQASEAAQALQDAVMLRLGLGQIADATRDAEIYVKNYGATKSMQAAVVAFAVAQSAVDREDWVMAKKHLAGWLSAFDRSGPLDLRTRAHAALGRAHVRLDDAKKAEAEYAQVLALWRAPAASA